jgi:thiol-disulfide isomerase/thioredoxin
VAVLTFAALLAAGGCDWFDDPPEENLPPSTTMESCPSMRDVQVGDDVTFEWTGEDPDGSVALYEWAYDDTLSGETAEESLTVEDVAEGEHLFEVRAVDDKGARDPSPATCEFTAISGGSLVDRAVLVEFLTASWCVNCPEAEEALLNLLDQYGQENLSVIAYHYPPGPLWTLETKDRVDLYHGVGVPDVFPACVFDGLTWEIGALSVADAQARYEFRIDSRMPVGSPISLEVTGSIAARGQVSVKVKLHDALAGGPNVVRIGVIENEIPLEDPPYEFVVRDMLDEETLTIAAAGDSTTVVRDFTVDPSWNENHLDVIAFVQNDTTLEIIQSVRLGNE